LDLVEPVSADYRRRSRAIDVLVVSGLRFRGRREERFWQLLRLDEARREAMTADLSGREVVLPSGPGEVPADDAFDREHLEPAALRRAAVRTETEQVVRDEVAGLREPVPGEAGEDASLVRDLGRQHDVERRDAVARDEQQPVVVEREEFTDLAAAEVRRGTRHAQPPVCE